jgi:HD-GYP domain-containing protein (c-di-GMP phosphodiesterase class II)
MPYALQIRTHYAMSATIVKEPQGALPLAGFVPVQVYLLRSTRADAADLFVQYDPQSEPVLYCRAGNHPDAQQFAELQDAGVENFYVRTADFNDLSSNVLDSLDAILQQETLRRSEKFATLQLAVAVVVEQTLRLVDCGKFLSLAQKVGDNLVALLGEGDVLPRELFRLARHDFTMFAHVTNVASYCVILAQNLGITGDAELRRIATGALLHDLGKRFIPPRIVTKEGDLTSEERELIETHPGRGYVELFKKGNVDYGQLMMVYQHHERVDGTGYPVRILKDEIHPWARMLSIVDVFDTMTAKRPNRLPATPEQVLEHQRTQAGTQFDAEFVECWISAMTKA